MSCGDGVDRVRRKIVMDGGTECPRADAVDADPVAGILHLLRYALFFVRLVLLATMPMVNGAVRRDADFLAGSDGFERGFRQCRADFIYMRQYKYGFRRSVPRSTRSVLRRSRLA